jgi:hypothetical protein
METDDDTRPRVLAVMADDQQLPMVRDVLAALGLSGSYSQPLSSATRTASARVWASSLPIADDR